MFPDFKLIESTYRAILEKSMVVIEYKVAVTNFEVEGSGEKWKEGCKQRFPHLTIQGRRNQA